MSQIDLQVLLQWIFHTFTIRFDISRVFYPLRICLKNCLTFLWSSDFDKKVTKTIKIKNI